VSGLDEFFLYLRKSNGRKAVPRQRAITSAYITKLGGRVAGEFTGADSTAFRQIDGEQPERDGFASVLAVLRSRSGLKVAVWHAGRLTRNPGDTGELIRVCAAGGHLVETPTGGSCDLSAANGRKRFRDDADDAAYEVGHGRERVLAARAEVAAGGRWLGGKRLFGWELDKTRGRRREAGA
jgi:site-specific DNA recombinase